MYREGGNNFRDLTRSWTLPFLLGMTGRITVLGRNSRTRIDHKLSEEFPAVQDGWNNSLPYRSFESSRDFLSLPLIMIRKMN